MIAYPLKSTLLEKLPTDRINKFGYAIQNYLKYLALLTASEFFNSNIKDKGMVNLFRECLKEPSMGHYNHYCTSSN